MRFLDFCFRPTILASLFLIYMMPPRLALASEASTSSVSDTQKVWPEAVLRGINTKLVFATKNNQSAPGGFLTDAIFKKFRKWNINVIRVPVNIDGNAPGSEKQASETPSAVQQNPLLPYAMHLQGLARALELAEQYHIFVVVSAGNIAGRKIDVLGQTAHTSPRDYLHELSRLWQYIAKTYGHSPYLLAYDLLNEPQYTWKDNTWQTDVLPELVSEIRDIDKETYLVIEPGPWGLPKGFATLKPIEDPKVVYSFHHYSPHSFTHQGIRKNPTGTTYPGTLRQFSTSPAIVWNREQLAASMQEALTFQRKYNVRIFVGELGVVRWAKGDLAWLEDTLSILEDYGWDWCYHSYGGWNGFNPTFTPSAPVSNEIDGGAVTDRLNLLLKYWHENQSEPGHEETWKNPPSPK